jgi:predicted SprT family Zn-dependent metalloprotease
MGIDKFLQEGKDKHKLYGGHEYDEKLEKWVDELDERFPVNLRIKFIEVSPRMNKNRAMAYRREGKKYYIRVSESFIERSTDRRIKLTVLHEMVHVYFYQTGASEEKHGKYFRWVLGRVGGSFTRESIHDEKWQACIEPFIEMEDE